MILNGPLTYIRLRHDGRDEYVICWSPPASCVLWVVRLLVLSNVQDSPDGAARTTRQPTTVPPRSRWSQASIRAARTRQIRVTP